MKCDICGRGVGNRQRVGPTGDNDFMILVDKCYGCGALYPVEPDKLSYKETHWVYRYNERMKWNYKNK